MNKDYLVPHTATILDALRQIDKSSNRSNAVLFVTDDSGKVIGSVSDGDCRRGFIRGLQLDSLVSEVMKADFTFLRKGDFDVPTIRKIRSQGLKYVPELNEDGSLYAVRDFTNGRSCVPVDAVLMAGGKGTRLWQVYR